MKPVCRLCLKRVDHIKHIFVLECGHKYHQVCLQSHVEGIRINLQDAFPKCFVDTCLYEMNAEECDKVSFYEISHIDKIVRFDDINPNEEYSHPITECRVIWKYYETDVDDHFQSFDSISPHIIAAFYRRDYCVVCSRKYRKLGILSRPKFFFELEGNYCDDCNLTVLISTDPLASSILPEECFRCFLEYKRK